MACRRGCDHGNDGGADDRHSNHRKSESAGSGNAGVTTSFAHTTTIRYDGDNSNMTNSAVTDPSMTPSHNKNDPESPAKAFTEIDVSHIINKNKNLDFM